MLKQLTQQKEYEQMLALSSYAFNKKKRGHEIDSFYQLCAHATNWGVKENNIVSSQVMSIPYQVSVGKQSMSMAGIGNVATYPENRGQGHIRQLFHTMLADLYEKKTALSYLAPFSYPFYRKFGYEQTLDRQIFQFTPQAMNGVRNERKGQIIRTFWAQTPYQQEIKACYHQTLGQQNGSLVRSDWDWQYVNERYDQRLFALCLDEKQQLVGYLIYDMNGSEFLIHELAATTDWSRRKLWGFVASHGGSFETFSYPTAMNEDLSDIFVDPSLYSRTVQPYMMSRIVHFQTFLTQYPWQLDKENKHLSLILGVVGDCCEPNNGQWEVSCNENKIICQKVDNEADFTATIQIWTQVLTGYCSFEHAVRVGLITNNSEKQPDILATRLPNLEKPMLYNYF